MGARRMNKANSKKMSVPAAGGATGPAPPGGPIEIVFSFDTTGSMSSCIAEVRKQVQEVIERLLGDIPGLRVAVFAHGDYCDKHNYITKWVDFSSDKKNLCDFVQKVSSTGGGDWEECYELVLRQVRTELSWSPGTQRSLVMIGDAIPHPKSDPQNRQKIDWKVETQQLRDQGVKIYSVQCMYAERAASFWEKMAEITGGRHLKLEQFSTIIDMIMSICYRETGPDFFNAYEKEVRGREGDKMRSELNLMFDALRDAGVSAPTVPGLPATPALSSSSSPETTCKPATKSRKRRGGEEETDDDSTTVAVKKVRTGKVTKKLSLAKKPSVVKKHSTGAKYLADRLVARAKKSRAAAAEVAKCCRESISSSKFMPELVWSKWYTAFQSEEPTTGASGWSPRRNGHSSYRHNKLFYHDTKLPAVYELAVQPKAGCKKYPMLGAVTGGFNSVCWDTYLTQRNHVQDQLDDVMDRGSKVFVRRGKINTKTRFSVPVKNPKSGDETVARSAIELGKLIHEVYDYAWTVRTGKGSRIQHRDLQKAGVQISDSKF